jgi:hypothetical protein
MVPSVRIPQAPLLYPALTSAKVPVGGAGSPEVLLPQHVTVPSFVIPQV